MLSVDVRLYILYEISMYCIKYCFCITIYLFRSFVVLLLQVQRCKMWLKGKFYIPKQTRSIFGWVGVHKSYAIRQLLVDFSFHYQQSLMMSFTSEPLLSINGVYHTSISLNPFRNYYFFGFVVFIDISCKLHRQCYHTKILEQSPKK